MMNLLLSIFLFFIVVLFILELLTICIYGFYISKLQQDLFLDKNSNKEKIYTNKFSSRILNTEPYVGILPFSLICKYYIDNYGIVPRWYKLHNILSEYYIKSK